MGSLVAELAEKLSSATNSIDFDEQTLFLNTSANTVGVGTNAPASKFDVRGTMQVGVDGTGHNVVFYGDTTGSNLTWNQATDALRLTDATNIEIGDSQDMQLFHNGTHSYITNATGTMHLATQTSGIAVSIGHTTSQTTINDNLIVTGTITGTLATAAQGNITSLGTLSSLSITGNQQLTGTLTVGSADTGGGHDVTFYGDHANNRYMWWDASADYLQFQDSAKAVFGNGQDLQIDHNGTDSYITNSQGIMKLATETSGIAVYIGHTTSETTVRDNLTVTGDLDGNIHKSITTFFKSGGNHSSGTITGITKSTVNGRADYGADWSESSGEFTPPYAGFWHWDAYFSMYKNNNNNAENSEGSLYHYDGSSWTQHAPMRFGHQYDGSYARGFASNAGVVDMQNTNHKVRIQTGSHAAQDTSALITFVYMGKT